MSIKIEAMQYQVTCKQCHQLYVVDTNPGTTIRSCCPYCGTVATIATPILGQQDTKSSGPVSPQRPKTKPAPSYSPLSSSSHPSSPTPSSPHTSSLTRRVVVLFCVVAILLLVLATLLYCVFKGMST